MMNQGYLELIIGPMYAGKSTELIKKINVYQFLEKKMVAINHKINNRYGTEGISTHNNTIYDNCLIFEKLKDFEKDPIFQETEIIIIEELQFFEDAFETISKWCDIDKKKVIAAGLDGDFERKPFGDVLRLIPYANNVKKINALCTICKDGTQACFSKRITKSKDKTLVGSKDVYVAVCRQHYLE
jgi:thymidine kinase